MEKKEMYYEFENGLYYFKFVVDEGEFYLLDNNLEWKFCPSLMTMFYDAASDYREITKDEMDAYIESQKKVASL